MSLMGIKWTLILRLLQRYVEILIDIKSVTGLVICVKMQTTRQIPSSKYAVKNCKDIIRTLNGIDFLMLTQFAPFQK